MGSSHHKNVAVRYRHAFALGSAALSLALLSSACGPADEAYDEEDMLEEDVTCNPKLTYFPVRGPHNTGYDSKAGNSSLWTCGSAYSNSDFIGSGGDKHLGIDIWAKAGTPIVAPVTGTVITKSYSSYSGNVVKIRDACGWDYYSGHLQGFASGFGVGSTVKAGTVVGYLGHTGSSSGGVNHLHFSIFPAGNYNAGINPHPYLKAVEANVCNIPSGGGSTGVPDAYQPFGYFDHLDARGGGQIGLYGWTVDRDTPTKALAVHVYVWGGDGIKRGPWGLTANQSRPDVGAAYPQYGSNHGYSTVIGGLPKGTAKVQVFAIDSSGKANDHSSLGVKYINVY